MNLRTYEPRQWPLFNRAMGKLAPVYTLVDVGAGIRPQRIVKCVNHICIEPYPPYAQILLEAGYPVICTKALSGLEAIDFADSIVMLDVIEHMEKDEGERVLEQAKACADQVIVFTPLGFMRQEGDFWAMGGEHWQRHRSGWMPDEFPGWDIYTDNQFHARAGAFFAIWNR